MRNRRHLSTFFFAHRLTAAELAAVDTGSAFEVEGLDPDMTYHFRLLGVAVDAYTQLSRADYSAPETADTGPADDVTFSITAIDPRAGEERENPARFLVTRTGNEWQGAETSLSVDTSEPYAAVEGEDYGAVPRTASFAAGQIGFIVEAVPTDDGEIEPHKHITLAVDTGLAAPNDRQKAPADHLDNDVLIILVSGRSQSGSNDNEDDTHPEHVANKPGVGIRTLQMRLRLQGFKEEEIKMFSSDGDDPDTGENGTNDSRNRVKAAIKEAAQKAGNRTVQIGMAGYSWGGGLIREVLEDISDDENAPANVNIRITAYIDAVEHGKHELGDGEELRPGDGDAREPFVSDEHINHFQGTKDVFAGLPNAADFLNGAFMANPRPADPWGKGKDWDADQNTLDHLNIDDHEPILGDITVRFGNAFGRRKQQ